MKTFILHRKRRHGLSWLPRFLRHAPGSLTVLASCLLLLALTGCHHDNQTAEAAGPKIEGEEVIFPDKAPQLSSIVTQPAEARTLAVSHLTGRLYWNDDVTVRVFTPVAGRVLSIKADLGQVMPCGAPLAEIDSPDFAQALADARTAVGNLAAADKALTRTKELMDHGAAAQKDFDAAQAAYTAALAERDRSGARLTLYGGSDKATNGLYLLRSPLAGVVVEKNINPGQEVRADQMLANATQLFAPLFVVSDPTKLWIQLDVAEQDLVSLEPGQQLRVHSAAFPDSTFTGRVEKIADSLDPSTRSIRVRGIVENPDKLLKAEMYVTVDVVRDLAKVGRAGVEIPSRAVFMKGNEAYLFVESTPGHFMRKNVKLGTEKDGHVPVLSGLAAGQKVVTDGTLLLQAMLEPAS